MVVQVVRHQLPEPALLMAVVAAAVVETQVRPVHLHRLAAVVV
jgi:hypothetical protein